MSEDQNPQNIYHPLIINQAYQGINTQIEPINQYGPQNNQFPPNRQYQQQIQQQQPQQDQYVTPLQYPQPYYIMDPNIIKVDPLPQSDKIKDQTEIEKVNFLTKLTAATLVQQVSQVILCMITYSNLNVGANFYNFETKSHNFIVYLCFFLLIGIILVAKYTKLGNDRSMAFFMFLSFLIVFDVFSCAFISGSTQAFYGGAPQVAIIWLLYFLEGYFTLLTIMLSLIYLFVEKKIPNIARYIGYIVAIQFVFIVSSFSFHNIYLGVFLIACSLPFALFYLYNMNFIIKGSNLNKDQFLLAAILVYFPY